jgi:hypothetical protein
MFPWNYGFHWSAGTIFFLGAFYTVLVVVATTVVSAWILSRREAANAEAIRWKAGFAELPARDRVCRHELTGEFTHRECPNALDCRRCETHNRIVAPRPARALDVPDDEIYGMSFPLNRLYHRGHTWVERQPDGTVTIGLDDLGQRLIGMPDAVELPAPGTKIRAYGTAWRMSRRNADVRVLSPVDGEVVATGGSGREWYLKVKPENPFDVRHLLSGDEVKAWIMRELERLQLALAAEGALGPSLADGGVPVADIAANYPAVDWDALCGEMFLDA